MKLIHEYGGYKNVPGVVGIFPSHNNLFEGEGMTHHGHSRDESCQMSTAVWCSYAIKNNWNEKDNPHDPEKHEKERIRDYTKSILVKEWFSAKNNDPNEVLHEMTEILHSVNVKSRRLGSGIGSRHKMLKMIAFTRHPVMIWMKHHMVAAFAPNTNKIYFYDNTIGLARCDGIKSLKTWVDFLCGENSELKDDNGAGVKWKCVECVP